MQSCLSVLKEPLAIIDGIGTAGALVAATAVFLGTIAGAAISVVGARIAARSEDRRQELQMAARNQETQISRRETLERQAREAAVSLSDAWARVVRAHDAVLNRGRQAVPELEMTSVQMVEAFTDLGSKLNCLLVLPINDTTRFSVLAVDRAVEIFRSELSNSDGGVTRRHEVASALFELFRILRETEFLRHPSSISSDVTILR